jgi:HSP20 family protein
MRGMTPESSRALEILRRRLYRLLECGPEEAALPAAGQWTPAAEIRLGEGGVVVELELPGVAREDVEVNVRGATLTVAGVRRLPEQDRARRFHQAERPLGRFCRSFTVPWELDPDSATAQLEQGVLTVRVALCASAGAERQAVAL